MCLKAFRWPRRKSSEGKQAEAAARVVEKGAQAVPQAVVPVEKATESASTSNASSRLSVQNAAVPFTPLYPDGRGRGAPSATPTTDSSESSVPVSSTVSSDMLLFKHEARASNTVGDGGRAAGQGPMKPKMAPKKLIDAIPPNPNTKMINLPDDMTKREKALQSRQSRADVDPASTRRKSAQSQGVSNYVSFQPPLSTSSARSSTSFRSTSTTSTYKPRQQPASPMMIRDYTASSIGSQSTTASRRHSSSAGNGTGYRGVSAPAYPIYPTYQPYQLYQYPTYPQLPQSPPPLLYQQNSYAPAFPHYTTGWNMPVIQPPMSPPPAIYPLPPQPIFSPLPSAHQRPHRSHASMMQSQSQSQMQLSKSPPPSNPRRHSAGSAHYPISSSKHHAQHERSNTLPTRAHPASIAIAGARRDPRTRLSVAASSSCSSTSGSGSGSGSASGSTSQKYRAVSPPPMLNGHRPGGPQQLSMPGISAVLDASSGAPQMGQRRAAVLRAGGRQRNGGEVEMGGTARVAGLRASA